MPQTYEKFEAPEHAADLFEARLNFKMIAAGIGVSLAGVVLFQVGPNIHNRHGRYFLLASIAMMLGGLVFAWILRHEHLYKGTGEKLDSWFRYFHSEEKDQLLDLFHGEKWHALKDLRFALDEGENDNSDASGNSSLLIEAHGVPSGDFLAVQVVEYIDRNPQGITPLKMMRGSQGKMAVVHLAALNQGT